MERVGIFVVDGMSSDGTREIVESSRTQMLNLQLVDNPHKRRVEICSS